MDSGLSYEIGVYTMKREEQIIQILKAFLEGKKIQQRFIRLADLTWYPVVVPDWDFAHVEYRVAPLKPDWIDWSHVNSIYKYMARDRDGLVYLYMNRPEIGINRWGPTSGEMINASLFTSLRIGEVGWIESLTERPSK